VLVGGVAVPRECLKPTSAGRLESDGYSSSHAADSHALTSLGIPSGIQMLDGIH
jgi:hypothetical protein